MKKLTVLVLALFVVASMAYAWPWSKKASTEAMSKDMKTMKADKKMMKSDKKKMMKDKKTMMKDKKMMMKDKKMMKKTDTTTMTK